MTNNLSLEYNFVGRHGKTAFGTLRHFEVAYSKKLLIYFRIEVLCIVDPRQTLQEEFIQFISRDY